MKRVLVGLCALAVMTGVAAAQQAKKAGGTPYAKFVTSEGSFTCELFEKDAPLAVENFIGLAEGTKEWTDPRTGEKVKKPYYNGLIFHRVIAGFMIQGGDPLGTGTGGPGYKFADEFKSGRKLDKAGILAMANAGPNTNGSQFFIVTGAQGQRLPKNYTIFGKVRDGMEAVSAIASVPTGGMDRPLDPVVIRSVKIEEPAG